ncbi:PREDICTED: mitochondrial import receptor subunit TOM40 homolog 1-like [Priapulus caudatus]|uniref:Mitochondrial import receptor subunit TOM40 homolog 1-like n=1 Tax=Priapulus caudatus TaxID=37621 RepID=A0ABM1EQE1_PRICU|nr:PREDICTED: mitochondrial import receptor subunit TOM40 homolog 1-like [Priapulus caudatus]
MGSVLATGPQPVVSPPVGAPPPPMSANPSIVQDDPSHSAGEQGIVSDKEVESSNTLNPGTFEDLHKKCKDVMPSVFEGAKLLVNKGLSSHFQISHTISMGSVQPSGYRFGGTYVGTKQYSPAEAFPILIGDVDPSGDLNANIIHRPFPNLQCKLAAQIQKSKFVAQQLTTDYKGSDFTASLTLGNIDVITESGVIVCHYLQRVTDRLAMGAELAYQYGQAVPGTQIGVLSVGGKYTGDKFTASGQIGGAGVHACYWHKASDQLQVGVELEANLRMQESVATIGYEIDMPKANVVFKGMFDSNMQVGAVLEKRLQPLPFTFALSAMMNHQKNMTRVGIGLILG